MTQVFYLQADYGLNVTYEWNNKITESFTGTDYCNAQWLHPITKINFSQAWFDQDRYDYIVNFYSVVKGNQDLFLVEDPVDNTVTNTPLNNNGIITQGIIKEVNGDLQLFKRYQLGASYVDRPITRPAFVQLYDNGVPRASGWGVDIDTGIVSGTAEVTDTWGGTFKIPMRFENDTLPIEIKGYDKEEGITTYSLPDLRMVEEKERLTYSSTSLLPNYNHYLQIPTQIGTQFETKTKTDIYTAESGYTIRDSLNSYRLNVSFPEFTATQTEINYLVGLQRLCLGEYGNFKYADIEGEIDDRFRFNNPINYTTLVDDSQVKLFGVNSLSFIQDTNFTKSTYCYLWRIICKDADERWFTNHDEEMLIEGWGVYPAESPVATSATKTTELKPDSTELNSVVNFFVTEADLLNGKYKNAEVRVSLFDWLNQTVISRLFTGNLGGYSLGYLADKAKQYQFEVVSLVDKLDSSRNVQTSSLCRHKFLSVGYGNCNLSALGRDDPLYEFSTCNKTVGACQSYGNIKNFGGQPRLPGIDETISRNE